MVVFWWEFANVTLPWADYLSQIATGVIIAWVHTVYEQFGLLAGKSAPNEFIQLVIYKAMTFSADIDKIDTVRAYHSGPVRPIPLNNTTFR